MMSARCLASGLQQLDMMFDKRAGLNPGHGDHADGLPVAQ
jgi:hypothetical protein